jgi:hypothetical protein
MFVDTAFLQMNPGFEAVTGDFSVEFWYKSSDPTQYSPILGSGNINNDSLSIYIENGGNDLQVNTNASPPSSITFQFPTPLQANTWTYFVISRSGTTESVWVDGIASPNNQQTDSRNYVGTTDGIFIAGGLLVTANVTDIKVNIGITFFDPSEPTITVPTNSLTRVSQTKLLMNTLDAASVFTDTSGLQTITLATGSVTYQVNSPYL